jgi:hypothetical protein
VVENAVGGREGESEGLSGGSGEREQWRTSLIYCTATTGSSRVARVRLWRAGERATAELDRRAGA